MADDQLRTELSLADVTEFFRRTGVAGHCPACSTSDWLLPDGFQKEVGLFNPRPDDGGYLMPGGIVPTVIVVCKNCGFIRQHAKAMILEKVLGVKLSAEPKPPESGDGK